MSWAAWMVPSSLAKWDAVGRAIWREEEEKGESELREGGREGGSTDPFLSASYRPAACQAHLIPSLDHSSQLEKAGRYPHFPERETEAREASWPTQGHSANLEPKPRSSNHNNPGRFPWPPPWKHRQVHSKGNVGPRVGCRWHLSSAEGAVGGPRAWLGGAEPQPGASEQFTGLGSKRVASSDYTIDDSVIVGKLLALQCHHFLTVRWKCPHLFIYSYAAQQDS